MGVGIATSAYALVGFKLMPELIRYEATQYVREEYGRTLSLGEIKVHPFKLHLEMKDISFPDRDRKRLFSLGHLFVNFQALASIWKLSWTFHEVTLGEPKVRAIIRPNGQLNLADLQGKPEPREDKDDELPRVWIEYLTVHHGELDFIDRDRARQKPFEQSLAPLSFTLKDFRTTPDGGDFQFAATAAGGARIAWKGHVVLSPHASSKGELAIVDYPAAKVAEYLGDALPFGIPTGRLNLKASYRASHDERLTAQVKLSRITANNLSMRALGEITPWVKLPQINVNDTVATLEKRSVEVAKITLVEPRVTAKLEENNEINLTRLFAPRKRPKVAAPLERAGKAAPPDAATSKPSDADDAWSVSLANVEVVRASVDLEDTTIVPGTRFEIAPVNASAEHVSLDLERPVPVKLDLRVHDDADLRASGTIVPSPFSAKLEVEVEDVELSLAQPYVAQKAALTIRDGSVSAQGTLNLNQASEAQPQLVFEGEVAFKSFKSIDDALRQDFVNFKGLDLKKVKFTLAPDALEIDRIVVKEPYARVVLSERQTLNISDVLSPKKVQSGDARPPASEAATMEGNPPVPEDSNDAMPVEIGTVFVNDMRMNFSDYFVKPNFSADIQSLTGTVKGLSTDPKSRAVLHLEGRLGANSPVVISGKTQPFEYDRFTEIGLSFQNISLPVFNPYSGRFAGYNIARGELSTDLHYLVQKRKLEAQHHIRIDQLTWGGKTATKEKAPFPVKLATAMLRDREGVITLDVPINGTLDDPKFRVWPVVWQAIKNVIVKAVTAPFDMLGALFKGAEKARFVEFAPGKADLDQNAKTGLAALNKALVERPKLTLDVPVGTVDELDRKALADQKFEEGLKRSTTATLSRRAKRSGVPAYAELDEDQKLDALEKLYEDLTGSEPELKKAPAPPKGTSRKAAKESKKQFEIEQLTAMARKKVTVEQREMEALGRKRAEAIEAELLKAGKLESSRVLVSKQGKVSSEKSKVRYELNLQ